jgi:hypothetical protein
MRPSATFSAVLGLDSPAEGGRAHKIYEQNGDHSSVLVFREVACASHARLECRSARGAEGRVSSLLGAAGRAGCPERRAARVAEASVRRDFSATRAARTRHGASLDRVSRGERPIGEYVHTVLP